MSVVTSQFEQVAETVAERTADLLGTQVSVVDSRGRVVASSDLRLRGAVVRSDGEEPAYLRVPLRLAAETGEVLIVEPGGGEVVPARLARVLTELIIDQAAVVDRLPNKHELKDRFIHELLHGSLGADSVMLREAQILGMDLGPPRVVILIDAAAYILATPGQMAGQLSEADVRRRAQHIIGGVVDFFELPNDTICAYLGAGEVAVLKASNRKNLGTWVDQDEQSDGVNPSWANLAALKRAGVALLSRLRANTHADISIGIGRYHAGLKGLSHSYEDARAALSLGRHFSGQNQVHCLDGLGIAAYVGVSDERTKVDLAKYVLSPLDHEPDLLSTLQTFFQQDCCPSASAAALLVHRNTLSYRLDKISSLTGLDPRRFEEAVQLRLALALRSL